LTPASLSSGPLAGSIEDEEELEAWLARPVLGGRVRLGFMYFFMTIGSRLPCPGCICEDADEPDGWMREGGVGVPEPSMARPDIILDSWAMVVVDWVRVEGKAKTVAT